RSRSIRQNVLVRGDGHAGSVTGFVLAVFAFFVAMVGTTLPTPLYPLFEQRYGFGSLLVTVIFAIYAFGVIAGLILFGHLSDQLGRKPLLLFGLGLSGVSAMLFLVAGSLVPIYAARIVSGLSAGIFTGTATAYVIDLAPQGRHRLASFVAVFANLGGLGTGTLLSGLLGQWAPGPLRTPFAVDLGLVALAAAGLLLVARLRNALAAGCGLLVAGVALLAVSLAADSLAALFASAAVAGLGQGVVVSAGLAAIAERAPAERRGETASSFFVVLYVGLSIPVIAAGVAIHFTSL